MSADTQTTKERSEEDALIERLSRNDAGAWDEFFVRYDKLIAKIVAWQRWRFDPPTREDVAQQIRKELCRAIPQYKRDASLSSYIKQVCIHRCIDEVRRQIRRQRIQVEFDIEELEVKAPALLRGKGPDFDPVCSIYLEERASSVDRLLEAVEDACRHVIRMFYIEELSYKVIAEALKVSVPTVGTRLFRCLEKMRHLAQKDAFLMEYLPGSTDET